MAMPAVVRIRKMGMGMGHGFMPVLRLRFTWVGMMAIVGMPVLMFKQIVGVQMLVALGQMQ